MKKLLFLMLFLALAGNSLAKKDRNLNNPVLGTWKFYNQSVKNDLQPVKSMLGLNYKSEVFIFETDNQFRHEFLNAEGETLKTLHGKWKSSADKIKISYTDINFKLEINYFFIDQDLVLGQNFNHVIFTKYTETDNRNLTLK
jgi:hypothetical protein